MLHIDLIMQESLLYAWLKLCLNHIDFLGSYVNVLKTKKSWIGDELNIPQKLSKKKNIWIAWKIVF